jgi:hypothetical protein
MLRIRPNFPVISSQYYNKTTVFYVASGNLSFPPASDVFFLFAMFFDLEDWDDTFFRNVGLSRRPQFSQSDPLEPRTQGSTTLWDWRFSRRWLWRLLSSVVWRPVVRLMSTDFSEENFTSTFRVEEESKQETSIKQSSICFISQKICRNLATAGNRKSRGSLWEDPRVFWPRCHKGSIPVNSKRAEKRTSVYYD